MTDDQVLVLRTCSSKLTSYKGFQWPSTIGAVVEAPDWDPSAECGKGLHGWLQGVGFSGSSNYTTDYKAKWLVLKVSKNTIVDLGGKVKFPRCQVLHIGDKLSATNYLSEHDPETRTMPVIGAMRAVTGCKTSITGAHGISIAGYKGTATSGFVGVSLVEQYGIATTEDYGTATAGDYGTATAGEHGTATTGSFGVSKAGAYGKANSGYKGTSIVERGGTATSGNHGISKAGRLGTSIAGTWGTAIVGENGKACVESYGKASAGRGGTIQIEYFYPYRFRSVKIGYIGENGLKPDTEYKLNEAHDFVEA